MKILKFFGIFAFVLLFSACVHIPTAKDFLTMENVTAQERELTTKSFGTKDYDKVFTAALKTIEGVNFQTTLLDNNFGLITSTKLADGQVIKGQRFWLGLATIASCAIGQCRDMYQNAKDTQRIYSTIVVIPRNNDILVRLTLQRIFYNIYGQIISTEVLKTPELYTQFFEKLSKSIFIEENL